MKNLYKALLAVVFLLVQTNDCFSQMSISYYGFKNHKIGLGMHFSKRVWSELKFYEINYQYSDDNQSEIDNEIAMEACLNWNIIHHDYYNFYLGMNGFFTYDDINYGIGALVGAEIFPFQSMKRLSFHIQMFPYIDDYEELKLSNEIGVRFRFYE